LPKNGRIEKNSKDEVDITISRLATIGQISAGIAHEVRNPLTAVKGFLQLLQEQHPHRYIEIANIELERAIDTLQDLLNVSKPDLDNEAYTAIHLCEELESLLYLFQDQLYHVEIEKKFLNSNDTIYGKKNQLKKAFFNLIKNAIEAVSNNGKVTIEHYRQNNHIYVCIHDNGVGIAEEKMQMIGTPFFTTKEEGTGMGLTQVFSTIYQHGAKIEVSSKVGVGTSFQIVFPLEIIQQIGVIPLDLNYQKGQSFKDYILLNQLTFKEMITNEATNTFDFITDDAEKESLLELVQKLVALLSESRRHELIALAKETGKSGAKSDFPVILILELIEGIRQIYWAFLYNYYKKEEINVDDTFKLERETNTVLDLFFSHYFSSYIEQKNELLDSHRELIDDLSVIVIPLSAKTSLLPVVGTMDTFRARKIQEKVLLEIANLRMSRIIIDLSGVAFMDTAVVGHMFRIIDGIRLMGCHAIITGIRPEIANTMIELGITLSNKVEIRSSLQQALEEYGL
jgi:anti-anti-sigma factor